jgi:hypothetical protein|tara:strand:+ start:3784 stop:4218 length:435 start_codon:yes stop_codon:yes gene_type:complete
MPVIKKEEFIEVSECTTYNDCEGVPFSITTTETKTTQVPIKIGEIEYVKEGVSLHLNSITREDAYVDKKFNNYVSLTHLYPIGTIFKIAGTKTRFVTTSFKTLGVGGYLTGFKLFGKSMSVTDHMITDLSKGTRIQVVGQLSRN